jgi:hypothetical protein
LEGRSKVVDVRKDEQKSRMIERGYENEEQLKEIKMEEVTTRTEGR